MSVDIEPVDIHETDSRISYRAVNTAAVASLAIGVLSALALFDWWLVVVPIVGIAMSLHAWRKVASHPDEFVGLPLARAGLVLSVAFLIAGPARLSYIYATEVPEGYQRISYADLQPDPDIPGQIVPPSALELEGKKVFIKGYVYPGRQQFDIKQFVLCADQGECCFGGNPKITDRIEVTLVDPLRLTYAPRLHKVAGTFHVEPAEATEGLGGVFYHLEATHLQ